MKANYEKILEMALYYKSFMYFLLDYVLHRKRKKTYIYLYFLYLYLGGERIEVLEEEIIPLFHFYSTTLRKDFRYLLNELVLLRGTPILAEGQFFEEVESRLRKEAYYKAFMKAKQTDKKLKWKETYSKNVEGKMLRDIIFLMNLIFSKSGYKKFGKENKGKIDSYVPIIQTKTFKLKNKTSSY